MLEIVKVFAFIVAGLLILLGVLEIVGAAASDAGLGPTELLIGLVPLGLAAGVIVSVSRQRR